MVSVSVLLVEDDASIIKNLSALLVSEGFAVTGVTGQRDALAALEKQRYDIVLLDISLSDGNGFAVCREVKSLYNLPVIFLTAADDETNAVIGLDLGADDYIAKPFRPRELISRIRSVLRRGGASQSVVRIGTLCIDTSAASVTQDGHDVVLSALEYRLLLVFVNNRGITLSRDKLINELWDIAGEYVNDNTLTVYIKRLREKIEAEPQNPIIIKTVRGLGYKME